MKNNFFVADTNILNSASLFSQSIPGVVVKRINRIGKTAASIDTFHEFSEVFLRKRFNKYISLETRLNILIDFKRLSRFFEIKESITACRDPKDNKFLELAVAANASCIITGDKELL